MRKLLGIWILLSSLYALPQAPMVYNWIYASDEFVELIPYDYHAGRVYRPASTGGDIHVIIHSKLPVTVSMTGAAEWNNAQSHPDTLGNLQYRCVRQHILDITYECHLPTGQPMVLVIHDERTEGRAVVEGIGAILGRNGARALASKNEVKITYHSWQCVANCEQPEYQWTRVVKEKYDLNAKPKLYSVVTPQYDGQRIWMKIKAQAPITIAVLPVTLADQAYDQPDTLSSALSQTTCKQRGIQTMEFECKVSRADGPQSLIILPDSPLRSRKKAEIEFQTLKCTANCELIPTDTGEDKP